MILKIKNIFLILAALPLFYSCDQDSFVFDVNCDECFIEKPDSADLIIYLTINEDNPYVPLRFYRGEVEENVVEWVDTAYSETFYLYSPVDEYYSLEAKYLRGSDTIVVVDGDKLKTNQVSDVCDTDCWIIRGGIMNARLRSE